MACSDAACSGLVARYWMMSAIVMMATTGHPKSACTCAHVNERVIAPSAVRSNLDWCGLYGVM